MIEITDLTKSFHHHPVLKGVNLTVKKGESMVIIGRSGCGKSVLLKLIIGLLRPDSGRIVIDGEEITAHRYRDLYTLRKRFGMVFQGSALFDSLTAGENVGLGLRQHTKLRKEEIREIVRQKLELVGLSGIESLKPSELSGGMKKRVGLARAIAMDPEFVLYDEPTTGLDPIMACQINELIRSLQERLGITSLAVTHDINSAYKIADRIAMLNEGKIIFVGAPEEIRSSPNPIIQQFIRGESLEKGVN